MEHEELNRIMRFADTICQTPGKPINIRVQNAVRIALRIGFETGIKINNKNTNEQNTLETIDKP